MNNPTVSVVVTCFNQATTLAQTLDSILSQVCAFEFEIIIGDDFSTDGSNVICEAYSLKYPKKVKPVFHNQNVGVAANFVLSVQQAKGDYIAICAADDFWHNPAKLQQQVDFLEQNEKCGLLYTDYDKLNVKTQKITKSYLSTSGATIYEGSGLTKTIFSGKLPALTVTVMFRKELFDTYIPAKAYLEMKFTLEDWPTWLILSKYTNIAYLPISTATYRYGHESISNLQSYDKLHSRFSNEREMYKYLCNLLPEELHYDENEYDRYVNGVFLSLAIKKSDYLSAKRYSEFLSRLGDNSIKIKVLRCEIGFYLYSWMKRIKMSFN